MTNKYVKTVYIHVGMPKTGTSSIQLTMAKNIDVLSEYGFNYSTALTINHSEFLLPIFLDNPLDFFIERERKLSVDFIKQEYIEKKIILENELKSIKEESLVFSAEGLYFFSDKVVESFNNFILSIFPDAKIKIIICSRNPSEYVASIFQQFTRTSYYYYLEGIIKETLYLKQISYFQNLFGKSNIVVYDFGDAKKHNLGLVGYFLQNILGLPESFFANIITLRDNDSISDTAINIISYINKITESPSSIFTNEKLYYERYLNDTQALWSLRGDKFKLDKEYVKELYEKLEPELKWLRENFNIDYNFENATYTEERYKIPNGFFETIKEAFPKLSRIVRRAFYEWLCEEIVTRKADEYHELEKTKLWIEKNYKALVNISLEDLKKQINQEIEACQNFFSYFKIENKQSYQLYYHLHLLLKEIGEYKASNTMLQHFYEKNPYWNDEWEVPLKFSWQEFMRSYSAFFNKTKRLPKAIETFKNTFGIKTFSNQQMEQQLNLFLNRNRINLKLKQLNNTKGAQ